MPAPRILLTLAILGVVSPLAGAADPSVLAAQQRRIETVERVAPAVVAIFGAGGNGGGSGVLISADGYVLTNHHVTQGAGTFMKCGLNDGVLYDGVIVGIDPTGDVAMVKLFGRTDFPFAPLGDSDTLAVGDETFAMGNPFLLATDFKPTVTCGIVSGTHRYQYPAGTFLEYTDCIQVDTSINPGNSGGPLFNAAGDLVGINGRISLEKRGRVNVGAGYAISINQIKHFMDHLRSGRIVDHATLGATVSTDNSTGGVMFTDIIEESEAYRRGVRVGDELVSFAGRPIGSVNQFKNVLGIYPKGWKLPLSVLRGDERHDVYVRLRGLHRREELLGKKKEMPKGRPGPKKPGDKDEPKEPMPVPLPIGQQPPPIPEHLKQFHVAKEGFANYYFNQLEQTRALAGLKKLGDYAPHAGSWTIIGKVDDAVPFRFRASDTKLGLDLGEEPYLQDVKDLVDLEDQPKGSGGLLPAIHHLRRFLTKGPDGFTEFYYLGSEPLDGKGEPVDVLAAELSVARSSWYFSRATGQLVGYSFYLDEEADPCEIRFTEFRDLAGVQFPTTWQVWLGNQKPQSFAVTEFSTKPATTEPPKSDK